MEYLNDTEQILFVWSLMCCNTSIKPSNGAMHRLFDARACCCAAYNIIQCHHDVCANLVLKMNRMFRGEQHPRSIMRRLECYAFLKIKGLTTFRVKEEVYLRNFSEFQQRDLIYQGKDSS